MKGVKDMDNDIKRIRLIKSPSNSPPCGTIGFISNIDSYLYLIKWFTGDIWILWGYDMSTILSGIIRDSFVFDYVINENLFLTLSDVLWLSQEKYDNYRNIYDRRIVEGICREYIQYTKQIQNKEKRLII